MEVERDRVLKVERGRVLKVKRGRVQKKISHYAAQVADLKDNILMNCGLESNNSLGNTNYRKRQKLLKLTRVHNLPQAQKLINLTKVQAATTTKTLVSTQTTATSQN